MTGEFSSQMASNAENVSIWWRHPEGNLTQFDKGGSFEVGPGAYDYTVGHAWETRMKSNLTDKFVSSNADLKISNVESCPRIHLPTFLIP